MTMTTDESWNTK